MMTIKQSWYIYSVLLYLCISPLLLHADEQPDTSSDIEIIQQLEQELGIQFERLDQLFLSASYTANTQNQVTGLHIFGSNFLTEIPKLVFSLSHLQQLYITDLYSLAYGNQTQSISPKIAQLQNLTELVIQYGYVDSLPPEIGQLQNLNSLSLSSRQLKTLPPEIGQLQNLNSLSLVSEQLQTLPSEIAQLQNLMSLSLRLSQLQTLPPEIGQLQGLTSFSLSGSSLLQSLPPEIGQLQNLLQLSLSFTQLTTLPAEIGQLKNLTSLGLNNNRLQSLPPEIGQLTKLTSLNLVDNQLESLPPEFGQLQSLESVLLWSNKLQTLPVEIGQLKNLTSLQINNNQLQSLPPEIGQLEHLTQLPVYQNQLQTVPPEISQLSKLGYLDLRFNPLQTLPPEITQLNDSIALLVSEDAPITSPPANIAKQGFAAMRYYFNSLDSQTARCTMNQCEYTVYFDQAGYYVANISLPETGQAGMWGLAIALQSDNINRPISVTLNDVSTGSSSNIQNNLPSWVAFYLARSQAINLTAYNYLTPEQPVLTSFLQNADNGRTAFLEPTVITPQQTFTMPQVEAGFYILETTSTNEQDIYAGLSIQGKAVSNIVSGGWIEPTNITEGFISFYVSAPSFAQFNLAFADNYATLGASQPQLNIESIDTTSGERTLLWPATSKN
ncbi:leucine-rich repeat domain-containing protein [Candidatus Albibeggiatoa sp. nov. NOAA]|uniref:leucine-rich repeat domain-containing protein n=1 Tax=Candidatus Albibeggiatoa sp. nov. NOAA TaxID=3162724 RepID=UPI0032FAF9A9|nr:leucine-rich repeat domain-containing protein [Thiotrichaceae bacterium]